MGLGGKGSRHLVVGFLSRASFFGLVITLTVSLDQPLQNLLIPLSHRPFKLNMTEDPFIVITSNTFLVLRQT